MDINGGRKIFLSHKGSDKDTVIDLRETLEELGYEPWLDDDAMPAGTLRERGLLQGMQASCAVVFFVTPSFKDEGYLATELDYAIEEKRCKRDRFAIITLRLEGSGDDAAPKVPGLLNRFIWKTPRGPLEALREIVRALPIAAKNVEWRDEATGRAEKPQLRFPIVEPSYEDRSILQEAVRGDGLISLTRTFGGKSITTNGKAMIPDEKSRTVARWVGGLEELAQLGYIRNLGYKGEVFEVTREGYEAADEILGTA